METFFVTALIFPFSQTKYIIASSNSQFVAILNYNILHTPQKIFSISTLIKRSIKRNDF